MAIPVTCPKCSKAFRAADNAAGKAVKCPACHELLRVPAVEQSMTTSAAAQPVPAGPAPAPDPMAEEFDVAGSVCAGCGVKLDAGAQFCVACGTYVATGKKLEVEAATHHTQKKDRKKTIIIVSAVVLGVLIIGALTAMFLF